MTSRWHGPLLLLPFLSGFHGVDANVIQFVEQRRANSDSPLAAPLPTQTSKRMVVRCMAATCTFPSSPGSVYYVPSVTTESCDSRLHWYDMYYAISWCRPSSTGVNVSNDDVYLVLRDDIKDPTTFLEVLTVPISAYNLHGAYGNRQGYWYVYLILTAVLATVYALFWRLRAWQALLAYAIAVYTAVAAENLYQSIRSMLAETQQDLHTPTATYAFAIAATSVGANLIPIVCCALVMRYSRCQPLSWSAFGLAAAFGSLFLVGAGWFVGPSLFGLGCLLRVVQRYC